MHALRPYLEYQADRVEAILAAHRAPAHISGGTVGPRVIRFFANPAPHVKVSAITALAADLALGLQVRSVAIQRGADGVILEFVRPHHTPVDLLFLLQDVTPLPPGAMLLGQQDNGIPLLAHLVASSEGQLLIVGGADSGKTGLLRSIGVGLVLSSAPAQMSLAVLDLHAAIFPANFVCPHLLRSHVITDLGEAREVISSLVHLMRARARDRKNTPRLVVLIDELTDLASANDRVAAQLIQVAQHGQAVGIHLCVATRWPGVARLWQQYFPMQVVGHIPDATADWYATGHEGVDANHLTGHGDFLAVSGAAAPIRFQAAHLKVSEFPTLMTADSLTALGWPVPEWLAFPKPAPAVIDVAALFPPGWRPESWPAVCTAYA